MPLVRRHGAATAAIVDEIPATRMGGGATATVVGEIPDALDESCRRPPRERNHRHPRSMLSKGSLPAAMGGDVIAAASCIGSEWKLRSLRCIFPKVIP